MGNAKNGDEIVAMIEERAAAGELHLPPFPEIAQRVLSASADESTSAETLAALVHRDAGLASDVLRYANSALSGASVRNVSIQQAIARLGIRRVSEIAIASSLRGGIASSPSYPALARFLWRHSLATAIFSREVTRMLRQNVEVAFLCGLLRGVGRSLVLDVLTRLEGIELPDEEMARGISKRVGSFVSAAAAQRWALPDELCAALGAHDHDSPPPLQAAVLRLSARLADRVCGEGEEEVVGASQAELRELNFYPDQVEGLIARIPEVRGEIEAWS